MNESIKRGLLPMAFLAMIAMQGGASADEDLVQSTCSQCHALSGDGPATLAEMRDRKGPDLSYAGNKYRREWLEAWLQQPQRIRPAGMFFANHVETREGHDEILSDSFIDHPVLGADDAVRVADHLMSLKTRDHLITAGDYKPGSITLNMGEMIFDRFRGCLACHEIEAGYGGRSGPEMYTAAARLQEDFMISFMRNPQAWERKSIMPNRQLTDNDLQRLVHYLRALNAEMTP